jgi:HAD superfamily hydrolase (TIGR01459 family)
MSGSSQETARAGPAIPIISSIEPLTSGREVWLADVWGVIHNGVEAFTAACDACTRFRLGGGIVLLLSNSPRPADGVAAQLDRIGVPRFAWDAIVTSGDSTRALLGAYRGQPIFHLGPERDLPLYDDSGVILASADEAVAVSCTGLFDDEVEGPDDYAAMLEAFAGRKLPMICANPDLTVERGAKIVYCAGALAEAYENLGGQVAYAGKPYLPIYDMAFATVAKIRGRGIAKTHVLAIGDGIRTDIAGAAAAGIDSVFIVSGMHAAKSAIDGAALLELFPDPAIRPIAVMPALAW